MKISSIVLIAVLSACGAAFTQYTIHELRETISALVSQRDVAREQRDQWERAAKKCGRAELPMMFDGYKWRPEEPGTGINDDIPVITPEWHNWHGDLYCSFIKKPQTVSDMKVGQCAFLWIVFRDANGDYLAFRPETVRPLRNELFKDHLIQMRNDGLHVWLMPGEEIAEAEHPLWRGVYMPVRVHIHSKAGSYYSHLK